MSETLLVGSYTEAPAQGTGLGVLGFDPATGQLDTRATLGGLLSPSWLLPAGNMVYAACEAEQGRAGLASIALTPQPSLRHVAPVQGDLPCHLGHFGRWIAVACYGSGNVTVHPLDSAAVAGDAAANAQHAGNGPVPGRQSGPHAHSACFSPDGKWLLVPDLGTDEVWCHPFDAATGQLGPQPNRWRAPPGSGPRHIVFAKDGKHAVLLTELSRSVISLGWEDGRLTAVDQIDIDGPGTAAALRWHGGGSLLAATIRSSDSVALIGFDAATGKLTLHDLVSCGGAKPRDCAFSPCGNWLLTANQDGNTIAVLRLDTGQHRLVDTGLRHPIGSPASLQFLPKT